MRANNKIILPTPDYVLIKKLLLQAVDSFEVTRPNEQDSAGKTDKKLDAKVMKKLVKDLDVANPFDQINLMLVMNCFFKIKEAPLWKKTFLRQLTAQSNNSVKATALLIFGKTFVDDFINKYKRRLIDDNFLAVISRQACKLLCTSTRFAIMRNRKLEKLLSADFEQHVYMNTWWRPGKINFQLLFGALQDALSDYLKRDFKNITFGFYSGEEGKKRATNIQGLIDKINPDDGNDQYKILLIYSVLIDSSAANLLRYIQYKIAELDPRGIYSKGVDQIFGAGTCSELLEDVFKSQNLNTNKRSAYRSALCNKQYFEDTDIRMVSRPMLGLYINTYLASDLYPNVLKDREHIQQFFIGKLDFNEIQDFLSHPPANSYLEGLPSDLRTELSSYLIIGSKGNK